MHTPHSERPADHVVMLLLWLAGVVVILYVDSDRGISTLLPAWFAMSLECFAVWWVLRQPALKRRWVQILIASAIPLTLFVAVITLLADPQPGGLRRVQVYAGYQFLVLLVLMCYAAVIGIRSRRTRGGSSASTSAA